MILHRHIYKIGGIGGFIVVETVGGSIPCRLPSLVVNGLLYVIVTVPDKKAESNFRKNGLRDREVQTPDTQMKLNVLPQFTFPTLLSSILTKTIFFLISGCRPRFKQVRDTQSMNYNHIKTLFIVKSSLKIFRIFRSLNKLLVQEFFRYRKRNLQSVSFLVVDTNNFIGEPIRLICDLTVPLKTFIKLNYQSVSLYTLFRH